MNDFCDYETHLKQVFFFHFVYATFFFLSSPNLWKVEQKFKDQMDGIYWVSITRDLTLNIRWIFQNNIARSIGMRLVISFINSFNSFIHLVVSIKCVWILMNFKISKRMRKMFQNGIDPNHSIILIYMFFRIRKSFVYEFFSFHSKAPCSAKWYQIVVQWAFSLIDFTS